MDTDRRIKSIAVVGGGTAGWMSAAALACRLGKSGCKIHLIESSEIPTVGVGEATIPAILDFLRMLGIDLADFIRHTQATFKLGIKFRDWRHVGHAFWHPFGTFGATIDRRPFYHYWQRAVSQGMEVQVSDFSAAAALGDSGKVSLPRQDDGVVGQGLRYALHFDAGLVARYLRAYAERAGVVRLERNVASASQTETGHIDELIFSDGTRHRADLYIDCSGFRGLLIEQTMKVGYLDWTSLLPCDRAVAMPTKYRNEPAPYTLAAARPAGWHWRIPLQHRAGNGYVFSSAYATDDEAIQDLVTSLGEESVADPRILRFTTGRRRLFWSKNCVAVGLSSGFLEPLESTSIQLAINGIYNLLDHFPDKSFDPGNIAAYNSDLIEEFESVRDFIILHYCTTERIDTPFWQYCRNVQLPDSLASRIELYRNTGRIFVRSRDIFTDLSWFYVLDGMGIRPRSYDPLADVAQFSDVRAVLDQLRNDVREFVARAQTHRQVLSSICGPEDPFREAL